MDIEAIRKTCLSFEQVTEDVKWGHDLVFQIGGKMFCVAGLDRLPVTVSFKVLEELFEEISARPHFRPAPYVAKYKWVLLEDAATVSPRELQQHFRQSYELVREKLAPKIKKQLGF